jgi:hypothetical protein
MTAMQSWTIVAAVLAMAIWATVPVAVAGNTSSNTSSNTSNNSSSDGPWRRDRVQREERRDFHTDRGGYSSGYYLDYDSGRYWQGDRRRPPRYRGERD